MPDGTAVLLVPHAEGVVVGTVGRQLPDGDYPAPSGLLVTGADAEMLAALVEVYESAARPGARELPRVFQLSPTSPSAVSSAPSASTSLSPARGRRYTSQRPI